MNVTGNLAAEERLTWIRARLDEQGSIRIAEAAAQLGVSEMTIRRDLHELDATGLARRVRGGAVVAGPVAFADRHRHGARAKARIAAKLLPLVPEQGAIGLDASSTVMRLASTIDGARDLTVVTNGPETFQALQGKAGVRAVLTGGELDARTGSLVGPVACHATGTFLLSRLFVSAAALDPELGASEATIEEAEVKRAMVRVASEVVLAVDSSKLESRSTALGLPWAQVTTVVTELDPHDDRLAAVRDRAEVL